MKFNCELKRVVDDSYDIEIGRKIAGYAGQRL